MLIGFPRIFEADTQKLHGYNFVVPLKNLHNADCEFYFIATNFFSIMQLYIIFHLLLLCTKYIDHTISDRFLNATRTYSVQCMHDLKVSLFVRSENYTQVCNQEFHRAGKVSQNKDISINILSITHERKPCSFSS